MEENNKPVAVDSVYIGPYKATRLWNDVISAFRQFLPTGRHRRYMRTFDNCFSGSSAIEWLLQYLKTNRSFTSDISRSKAVSLVNKLYRAGIFEEVKVSKTMRHKQDVQENRLYKFLPASPSKVKISRLPLAPRNDVTVNLPPLKDKSLLSHDLYKPEPSRDPLIVEDDVQVKKPQSKLARKISILKREKSHKQNEHRPENVENYPPCHLVTRVLTTKEIKDTWKTVFTQRLKKALGLTSLGDIISLDVIDGYNIMHNCIYMNKSGIVTNIDAKDQLPHWVMSAMKCLARWPEPPEPGLPSYPGFEKDVFGVVKDYFIGLDEPLVPFFLYDVITNVFVMAGNRLPRHSSPHHNEESSVPSSLWTSSSLENIILNLTKKYCLLDNTDHHYGTHEDLRASGMQSQKYGTQEDLRFVSHLDHYFTSYNRSAFPSTDGMDKLGESKRNDNPFFEGLSYGLASQESCPSIPGMSRMRSLNVLSKTSQSMGETGTRPKIVSSGINRKYGSTPNLKVSRYETAFGPDNRTVTRVFFQNGMTTDFGHNDVNSPSLRDIASIAHKNEGNNLERVKSAESLAINRNALAQGNGVQPTVRTFKKSKSIANMGSPQMCTENFVHNGRQNTSFSESNATGRNHSSSFYGSTDSINFERDHIKNHTNVDGHMNNSRESGHFNSNRLAGKCDSVDQNSFHPMHSKSAYQTPQLSDSFHTPLSHKSLAQHNLVISANPIKQTSSTYDEQPSNARVSVLSSPAHFYASEEKPSPLLNRKSSATVCYGNKYKSDTNKGLLQNLALHDESQGDCDINHENTPAKNISPSRSSGYGPGYRPTSDFYGPGYKPILDASKERRSLSSNNLSDLHHAPARTGKAPTMTSGFNR